MDDKIEKAINSAIGNISTDNLNVTKEQIEYIKKELKNGPNDEIIINKLVEISENKGVQKKYVKQ